MIEVAVGERFYYNGKYCEVVEAEPGHNKCSECDLASNGCCDLVCSSALRADDTEVCFKWVENRDETVDETLNKVPVDTEDCNREKTLTEEISELEIDESLKERILARIESLEKRNDEFVETINRYHNSTRRLERTIVRLAAALADNSDSVIEDEVIHRIDIGTQTLSSRDAR